MWTWYIRQGCRNIRIRRISTINQPPSNSAGFSVFEWWKRDPFRSCISDLQRNRGKIQVTNLPSPGSLYPTHLYDARTHLQVTRFHSINEVIRDANVGLVTFLLIGFQKKANVQNTENDIPLSHPGWFKLTWILIVAYYNPYTAGFS